MSKSPEDVATTMCAKCGQAFVCGAVAGISTCWCMQKPVLACEPEAGAGCYCPACLAQHAIRLTDPSSPAA